MSVGPSVLIAAGGTGGHIFPGIALADAIKATAPAGSIAFIGTDRGLEKRLIPDAGYPLELIGMKPLERRFGLSAARALTSVFTATAQARRLIRERRADVVVGMGGYPTFPSIAAAASTRVPSIVHESGAVAGLANRAAGRLTRNVALAFSEASGGFPRRSRPRVVGMPLRAEIASMDRDALRNEARATFGLDDDRIVILIMGGSLGALRLNELALGLAGRWRDRSDVHIILKAGSGHLETTRRDLEALGASRVVTAVEFLDRMDLAYSAADLAITRAGAGTVAELPAAGLGAVLVPYPHAPGDHQTLNARALAAAGAAIVVPDSEATATALGPRLDAIVTDPKKPAAMGESARALHRPHAAQDLARWVLSLVGSR